MVNTQYLDVKEESKSPSSLAPKPRYTRTNSNASSMRPPQQSKSGLDLEEISRKRVEKDLSELQQLINYHFEERKREEKELADLKGNFVIFFCHISIFHVERIEKRKEMRAQQHIVRQQRERERREREKVIFFCFFV